MVSAYPACFYEEHEGGYSVIFPDLNHLATQGDDLNEALAMAINCLAGYINTAKAEGARLQLPSSLASIDVNAGYDEYKSAFVNIVAVDAEEYAKIHFEKSVK